MKTAFSKDRSRLLLISNLLNQDFCPGFNRYVYWLKEPVGWFVLATCVSVLVGACLSPIGWTLAAGLFAILMLGLGFPWLAVRTVHCELTPTVSELHEQEESHLLLTIRNRLPIPLWGLMVEGFLTRPLASLAEGYSPIEVRPDVGLASVPPLSLATFRLKICPEYRGVYPVVVPKLACAFPFGIWTARRTVDSVQPVVIWPLLIPLNGLVDMSGSKLADIGVGNRTGTDGDFLGVRTFRRGDSLRSIHWAQTARNDSLIVCERGGPQQQTVAINLRTTRGVGGPWETRENLAWRVRMAASLVELLSARHIPFQLLIDDGSGTKVACGPGLQAVLNQLAEIPLDVTASASGDAPLAHSHSSWIEIAATDLQQQPLDAKHVRLTMQHPATSLRSHSCGATAIIDLDRDISFQLNAFLMEASHVRNVA